MLHSLSTLLRISALALLLGAAAPLMAQNTFTLAPLPYALDALEPVIDEATMRLHHGKHHQGYVDGLNNALRENDQLRGLSLEELLARVGSAPAAVRNNAGGHWNHTFFWESMKPVKDAGTPSAELTQAINEHFGSLEKFKAEFKQAGTSRFGSGWVWLIVNDKGDLQVTSTPNQDNPLMDIADVKGTPILGNDVWEHAYYLKHNNRRGDYLEGWWQVVDWKKVSERFAAAKK